MKNITKKASASETERVLKVKKRGVGLEKARYRAFYAIMAPFIFFFLLTQGYPLVWGLYISFTNFTGFNLDNLTFVGLANFKRVFVDNEALPSILRVIGIGVITVPVGTVICVTISLILSNTFRGVGVFRTLFYLPSVIPAVAIALMWKGIYAYDGGLFNFVRELFGAEAVNWLGFDYVKRALIIMMLWTSGGGALTIIAAIKGIPDDLYEAADIEGVGPVSKTFKITLPLVSNMIYMHITTSIIGTLQLFAQPVLLAGASGEGLTSVPIRPVYTYLVHVYQQIFVNMRFGYGMAMVWVIFAIIMTITFVLEGTKKYWVYTESN